ncbi:MAG: GNAT family N-acetyltransferase [Clostridia bacterium]|nr:GNAT family N-acetyltransferase [Clostridia bacterium]
MPIRIRTAVEADRERIFPLQKEIADLHHAGRPDLFKTQPRFYTEEDFSKRLNDPDHSIFIAEDETGSVVGYAFCWVIHNKNHPTYIDFDCFYIDDICVLKSCQRNGIGRKLFERCKQRAQEQHCKMIDLSVWSFNKEAIAFYESCGLSERIRRMSLML